MKAIECIVYKQAKVRAPNYCEPTIHVLLQAISTPKPSRNKNTSMATSTLKLTTNDQVEVNNYHQDGNEDGGCSMSIAIPGKTKLS